MTHAVNRLNPPTLPDSTAMGYSQITTVEPGRMAYVSGQVASRANGEPIPDDLTAQARIVAENAKAALDAVGATPEDIVIARIYMTDLNERTLEQAFPAILEVFAGAQPCVTGIGVAALAGPNLKIEMEMTVRLPD